MTNKEFIQLVKVMRELQKSYFKARRENADASDILKHSKSAEKLVDQAIQVGIGDDIKEITMYKLL